MDPKQDLPDAMVREVLEETGIRVQFHSLLGFRHTHHAPFGKSDMYFLGLLTLEGDPDGSLDLQSLDPDWTEVAQCKWMPVREFADSTLHEKTSVQKLVARMASHCLRVWEETRSLDGLPGMRTEEIPNFSGVGTALTYHVLEI